MIYGTGLQNSPPEERLDGEFVLVDSQDLANPQHEISLCDRRSVRIWRVMCRIRLALLASRGHHTWMEDRDIADAVHVHMASNALT